MQFKELLEPDNTGETQDLNIGVDPQDSPILSSIYAISWMRIWQPGVVGSHLCPNQGRRPYFANSTLGKGHR